MVSDLAESLLRLVPRAIAWAEAQSLEIRAGGQSLNEEEIALARAVGVISPQYIRVKLVECLPLPEDAELREVALAAGLLGPGMIGLTLGYGIYLCHGHVANRLLSHECRHVYQYESAGSISAYLPVYLGQIAEYGYEAAPLEIDARSHERDVA